MAFAKRAFGFLLETDDLYDAMEKVVARSEYRGVYLGEHVALKVLRSKLLNDALEDEFAQEVAILRTIGVNMFIKNSVPHDNENHITIISSELASAFHVITDLLHSGTDVTATVESLMPLTIRVRSLHTMKLLEAFDCKIKKSVLHEAATMDRIDKMEFLLEHYNKDNEELDVDAVDFEKPDLAVSDELQSKNDKTNGEVEEVKK
ncbi:hypothetical protein JHK87_003459 [Glycine soja]|nr:hypothetical protein JHK87_003459 [Glycine soja]